MNGRQRLWLAGCLCALALALATYFLTWDVRLVLATGYEPPVIPFGSTSKVVSFGSTSENPDNPGDPFAGLINTTSRQHGVFVREGRSPLASLWSGLVPLLLIAGAGYLALGARTGDGR